MSDRTVLSIHLELDGVRNPDGSLRIDAISQKPVYVFEPERVEARTKSDVVEGSGQLEGSGRYGCPRCSPPAERRRSLDPGRPFLPLRVPRLPWDAFFLLQAHLAATRSTCDRGPELLLDPGRHGVGAVLVRENRLIAGGYNGSPPGEPHCSELACGDCGRDYSAGISPEADERGFARAELNAGRCPHCGGELRGGHIIKESHCVRTLHAEENALLQCALDGVSPAGATVYTTAGPCYDCAKRLLRVGVSRVVFAASYESRYGLSRDALALLRRGGVSIEFLDVREYLGKKEALP